MKPLFRSAASLLSSLVLLLCAAHVQDSFAFGDGAWPSKLKIQLDTTAKGLALQKDVAQVPVLLRLDVGNFNFAEAKPGGADLRFVAADDKTPLKYAIESYDDKNNLALIWVLVPQLKANSANDFIWMYYGNKKVESAADSKTVYDANQVAVYHFAEPAGDPHDATAYGNHATQSTAAHDSGSLIGGGLRFDGKTSLTIPPSASMKFGGATGFTFSVWLKAHGAQKAELLQMKTASGNGLVLNLDQSKINVTLAGATPLSADLSPDVWHHVALTADKRMTLYIDGKEVAATDVALPVLDAGAEVGRGYSGELDELALASVARSADWILAAAGSQGQDSHLVSYGEADAEAGQSSSYFGTILRSVTTDGWVVIAVLVVMAAISWMVMVNKALVIKRTENGNKAFLEAFDNLGLPHDELQTHAGDAQETQALMSLLDKQDKFRASTLFRVYHTGAQELKNRLYGVGKATDKVLSPQAIDSIRAKLDGTLVRENQKLNALMVLLTIAISGGPFLGLLGTVVGVMITFAAIAATGDVNVAAIAPGIAAALVATVAGLAVAIPALFGYNYLGSRIKAMSADMHVFVDELLARMAETHS